MSGGVGVGIGVGPWVGRWPQDARLDPELLRTGDTRNVVDRYRYWTIEAIRADLDARRPPDWQLHVAIENWTHDFNIGSVVRTANAFNVAGVHIVGRRKWNRRGAMVTEQYLHLHHHREVPAFAAWCAQRGLPIIGIDNLCQSVALEPLALPDRVALVFGQESGGLSPAMVDACQLVAQIAQHGSTRSLNAGAAAAIAMYHWATRRTPLAARGGDPRDH